jgi:hypothetical protein
MYTMSGMRRSRFGYHRAGCGVRSGGLGGVQHLPIELIASQRRDPCSAKVNMVQ